MDIDKKQIAAALTASAGAIALVYAAVTGEALHVCPECPPCSEVIAVEGAAVALPEGPSPEVAP